ncbi:TolC family protein [Archangium primigenium]|uniref:TolC family protein n=1 Tax=[Archangium] primigenium TaxID=2792470 RepID=UPI00195A6C89|nr:TolC family protein [Archangium primigenium]MBM7116139.1 TolC family protein [Archangium primigenium]
MSLLRRVLVLPLCAGLALAVNDARAQESLSLERAVSLAAAQNETVLAAGARAEAAEARVARARAFFLPRLTVTGGYTRRPQETTRVVGGETVVVQRFNALRAGVSAQVQLFDARGIPLYQSAAREKEAAALNAVEARRQVAFQAATAFLSTLGQEQVAEAAQRRLDLARQSMEEAKARATAGLASTNDVTRAQLDVATAEATLADAIGQAATSRLELGYLLVAPVEGPLAQPETLLDEASRPVDAFKGLSQGALERRPDLLAARLRVEAQQAFAREPLARLFPAVSASAQYTLNNESGLAGRTGNGFLAVDLVWTLFDGGERYADRRDRLAQARALEWELAAGVRRVDVAVARAEVSLRTAQASLSRAQVAVDAARLNSEETSLLYRQGLAAALALSDAQVRQYEAEVTLAQARYSLGTALLELRAAVGLDPLGKEP